MEVNEEAIRDKFGLAADVKITARMFGTVTRGDGTVEYYDLATGDRVSYDDLPTAMKE
jgi:hypothetical protein